MNEGLIMEPVCTKRVYRVDRQYAGRSKKWDSIALVDEKPSQSSAQKHLQERLASQRALVPSKRTVKRYRIVRIETTETVVDFEDV